jgi:Family of unknown function (DUF5763)
MDYAGNMEAKIIMKKYFAYIFIASFFVSCNNNRVEKLESDVRELKQKVQVLENRVDSLSGGGRKENILLQSTTPKKITTKTTTKTRNSYGSSSSTKSNYSSQCMATTKKGTRCSRKSRSNGYCWQHGG